MQKTFVYHENASGNSLFRNRTDTYAFNEDLMIYAIADAPLRALTRQKMEFPFGDWSAIAADLFCETFVQSATEYIQENNNYSLEQLNKDIASANHAIKHLNEDLGKKYNDPNNYDIAETVSMVAVAFDNKLYYGGLEDCYVFLLDGKELKDKHKYDYQIMKSSKYLDLLSAKGQLNKFANSEIIKKDIYKWEPTWAGYLRNNLDANDDNGDSVGWGCFTGEEKALDFVQTHEIDIEKGDHLMLLTNAMVPGLNNINFVKWLVQNVSTDFDFQKEVLTRLQEINKETKVQDSEKLFIYKQI